jgi:hypothetical protein
MAGLLGAAGAVLSGEALAVQGPRIVTLSRRLDDRNHVFITSAKHGRYLAKIVTAREITGKIFATTTEILDATGAFVCLNGSFFEDDGSPSGLFVTDRRYGNSVIYGKGDGILYVDKDRQLNMISKYHLSEHRDRIVDALQVNIFTEEGLKLYQDKEHRRRVPRNLIGLSPEGIVDVIYKDTNFTLGDRYMRGVHGCTVVGALDGGGSASAVDRLGRSSYSENQKDRPEAPVANFILLFER